MKYRGARPQIKAVFFDFDGVLTTDKTGSLSTLRYLSRATGIELSRLHGAFGAYNKDLNLGRTKHSEIWPHICQKLGAQVDIGLLPTAFESTPFNDSMVELTAHLKRQCSVGIITDNKADRIAHIKAHRKLTAMFYPIVVSAEVGSDKEGSQIFKLALSSLGVSPCQSIFIDNTEQNLVAPGELGINTIFFDDEANDLRALRAVLREEYGIAVPSDV